MDHAPFIIAAYSVAAVLLSWCAVAPLQAGRKLRNQLRRTYQSKDTDHASKP
jgi:heme exporter protein CcmD